MGVLDGLYSVFFKRSTIYVPMLLTGAYFSNEALDLAVYSVWNSRNKGKSYAEIIEAREARAQAE